MLAPIGHVFVSDIGVGKVFKVRVSHYPANVTVEIDPLGCPIGIAVYGNVLYCADAKNDIIAFKDLTGETVAEVNKLTVEQLQEKLKAIGAWDENDKRKTKKPLQDKLSACLKTISGTEGIYEKGEVSNVFNKNCIQTVQLEKPVKQPVALCFDDKRRLYVGFGKYQRNCTGIYST